jgi:competence protein CoiA
VSAGLARFVVEPCERWCQCPLSHGEWRSAQVPLSDFVAWVLDNRIVAHQAPEGGHQLHDDHRWWDTHWTAPAYAVTATDHDRVELERRTRAEQQAREREATLARVRAAQQARREEAARFAQEVNDWRNRLSMMRRWRVEDAATRWAAETADEPGVAIDYQAYDNPRWADGLPLHIAGRLIALLRP